MEDISFVDPKVLCLKPDDRPATCSLPKRPALEKQKEIEPNLLAVQQRLTLLNEITKAILFDMSVMDIISYTLSKIHLFSPYCRVVYSTIDRDNQLTVIRGIEPSGMVNLQGKKIDMRPAKAFTEALHRLEIIACSDVHRDIRFAPIMAEMISGNIKATLVAPLSHSNNLVGLICMDASTIHRWSVNEVTALREVAQYLSIAIKNAQLQEKRRRDAERLGKWAHVFENAQWGIAIHEPEKAGIGMMNPAYARMHGYTPDELSGKSIVDLFAPDSRDNISGWLQTVSREGHLTFESIHVRKDGSTFPALTDATAVREKKGRIRYMIMNTLDITEQKRVENTLRLEEERLEALLKLSQMNWCDNRELSNYALEEAVRLTRSKEGYLHFLCDDEKTINEFTWSEKIRSTRRMEAISSLPLDTAGIWTDSVQLKKAVTHNNVSSSKDITGCSQTDFPIIRHMSIPIIDDDKIVAVAGVGNKTEPYNSSDIRQLTLFMNNMWKTLRERTAETEKKKLENQLRQAQKMEAIGTLAGGIAHDFNNILAAVLGHTDLIMGMLPKDSPLLRHVGNVLKAGERAKDLVNQILTFSRQAEQEYIPLKVHLIVKEALKLLRASIPSTIMIKQELNRDCGAVMADPTQIHQVVMNLCTNAYHAMKETGGVLYVSLEPWTPLPHESDENSFLPPGSFLKLEIRDTGCGISDGDLEKIFDPYFTTKGKGEGTGLGLSIVHGIIGNMKGTMRVQSKMNQGTVFQVFLPTADAMHEKTQEDGILPIATGSERILVVDDEDVLVEMNRTILESAGYTTIGLSDSADAFNIFRKDPDAFDLLLTDMTMPGMTGVDLAREFFSIRPEMPVILCTGYSDLIDANRAKAIGIHGFVKKPVIKKELAGAVRKVLDDARS